MYKSTKVLLNLLNFKVQKSPRYAVCRFYNTFEFKKKLRSAF